MLEQGQHSDPDVRTEYVVNSLKQMQQIGADMMMRRGRRTRYIIGNKMPELPNFVRQDQQNQHEWTD